MSSWRPLFSLEQEHIIIEIPYLYLNARNSLLSLIIIKRNCCFLHRISIVFINGSFIQKYLWNIGLSYYIYDTVWGTIHDFRKLFIQSTWKSAHKQHDCQLRFQKTMNSCLMKNIWIETCLHAFEGQTTIVCDQTNRYKSFLYKYIYCSIYDLTIYLARPTSRRYGLSLVYE